VYFSLLDIASGALSAPELAAATANPSDLAVHPTFNFLYAANEVGTFSGKETGSVSAFAIDRVNGKLAALNQESSRCAFDRRRSALTARAGDANANRRNGAKPSPQPDFAQLAQVVDVEPEVRVVSLRGWCLDRSQLKSWIRLRKP
jgi:hypothetical protein